MAECAVVCRLTTHVVKAMRRYICVICGFVYKEEQGMPEVGLAPGTRWEEVPMDWQCPDCGAAKKDFEVEEM